MRWQRIARLLIAALAVTFAIVVAMAVKRRAPVADMGAAPRADSGAVVESTGGSIKRFKLSREDVRVDYEKNLTYADGSTKLLGITIVTDNRAGGRTFTIKAKTADIGQNESAIALTGDVRLTSSEGTSVRTEHAIYSEKDGVIRADGPVSFSSNGTTGSGIGMTYDNGRDILEVLAAASVHVAGADEPTGAGAGSPEHSGGIDASADRATLARRDKYVRFDGHARLHRASHVLESDAVLAGLGDDGRHVQTMQLRGNSRLAGAHPASGGLEALTGRDMNLKYAADGQTLEHAQVDGDAAIRLAGERGKAGRQITGGAMDIDLAADGTTPVGLDARENIQLVLPADAPTPARTIRAARMVGTGEGGRGLTRAQFSGNVQYQERGPGVERTATAGALDVAMKPGLGAIEDARFTHAVRFVQGRITATSAAARYDEGKGLLELTGTEPGAVAPHVVTEQIAVDGTRIDLTLAGPKMKVTGKVKSVMRPASGSGSDARVPSMLKQDQPVNVTADALDYDGPADRAVYTGAAQLWQTDTSIKGGSLSINSRTGDLVATGPVTTVTVLDEQGKDARKTRGPSTATAKGFTYEDTLHRATYTGDAHMSGPDGDLTAAKIELYLKPSGHELDRVEGYDAVTMRDDKHKTNGTRLTYTTADERYVIVGLPVTIVDECGRETKGKTLTYVKVADTIVIDGNEQTRTQTKGSSKCAGS